MQNRAILIQCDRPLTNNEQKNWTNAVPQQGFGQQRAALPNKLRRYARTHTWPVLEHMAQTHASRLTIFICWAFSCAQVPSEMILTLPRRESFWFSLCQRENLFEAKPVDVRLRRNEGREGKSFSDLVRRKQSLASDCKTVFSSQTTQRQCCSSSLEGRSDFVSPANHTRTLKKERGKCCHELEGCLGWCATRGQRRNDDAQRPSQPADLNLKEHVHHTSWTFRFECAHQGSDMVTFKRNWPSFAVLV